MNAALWSGLGLVAPLQARVDGRLPVNVGGISIDTRTLLPGDLFFAILGDSSDGHDYVEAAFAKGAAAAVVAESRAASLRGFGPLYIVKDVLASLENLGRAARARSNAQIIAVTGSVGKTSFKEALRTVLGKFGETHASAASYNNHWGVPLSLARLPTSAHFGIFEIGMNHAGEIRPLVAMVQPHITVITTVAPVHLAQFESIDAIAAAKAEIFTGIVPGGTAILHADTPQSDFLIKAAREAGVEHVLTFGLSDSADAHLDYIELLPDSSLITATIHGQQIRYALGAPGQHLAINSLGLLLAAQASGVHVEDAAAALADVKPFTGRGARLKLQLPQGPIVLIDESYNANPASMRAAIALLGASQPAPGGRRIAVLGDMLELGAEGEQFHAELKDPLLAAHIDLVFCGGPLMKHLYDALPVALRGAYAASGPDLFEPLKYLLNANDVIMVKGSNGSRMGKIVAGFKSEFQNIPVS
jgi:UDP-N-acetylmuramoyl-tripeptide--D-alanyl-D-alanine ligase